MIEQTQETKWMDIAHDLSKEFGEIANKIDLGAESIEQNYIKLKENGFLKLLIPVEFGGEGITHSEMCNILKIIAQNCASTALALSMHQHLLAANIWKYRKGQGGEAILKKIAENQLVLVSTGAKDWLESNGEMQKVEGGYKVNALKYFASQSSFGDMLITSAPYNDPKDGWQVLHFPVPTKSQGISILNDWQTLGMRGTCSNTVKLENVFIPESSIVLKRPKGIFHPSWTVVLTVAMPLIMSVYVGIAEKAFQMAVDKAKVSKTLKGHTNYLVGEMNNQLTSAQIQWKDMIRICNNFNFEAAKQNAHDILTRKTNVATACIKTVSLAMEIVGGQGFYQGFGMERLFRDVHAANYHPLAEKDQQLFSGEFLLNEN